MMLLYPYYYILLTPHQTGHEIVIEDQISLELLNWDVTTSSGDQFCSTVLASPHLPSHPLFELLPSGH